jgi:hypothetical protein
VVEEETGVPGDNHQPDAGPWQTLSHNVISSRYTPHLGIFDNEERKQDKIVNKFNKFYFTDKNKIK